MEKILTTCVYCGTGCGLYLCVENGRVVGTLPVRNHPVGQGRLCIKGWNAHQFVHHPDRLTRPLIKRDGIFQEASWDEALGLVAEKLTQLKRDYGSDSLAVLSSAKCTNEENFVMMKFARAVLGTNNVDHCARLCHASTVAGLARAFGSGAMTNSINELKNSRVILIQGSNTSEQHPIIAGEILKAYDNGAKIIVIDPRRIHLCDFAVKHLPIKPGTDVALVNGLMNVILEENLQNSAFIAERIEGFAEMAANLKKYTPEYVSGITGVPAEDIREVARLYSGAERASIIYCMGITQHAVGTDNVISLANLAMLCGQLGRESTGVNPLRGQQNVQGSCDAGALPDLYCGYQRVTDEAARHKFEQAWNVKLPDKPGLTVIEMMNAVADGRIKGMYIMGENPIISDPDSNHVKKTMANIEFLVVQDIFLTETAKYAHVVLPACSFAEKDGTFTSTERRVQQIHQAIDPVGESRPDWAIVSEVGRRMGYNMSYASASAIMDEMASLAPIYGGISYSRLGDFGLQWPCPNKDHPGTPYLHKAGFTRGKGKMHVIDYIPPAEMPDKEFPFVLTTGRLYYQYHTRTMTGRSESLNREAPEGYVEINPADAKQLKIRNGEKVKVTSRRGQVITRAVVTDVVPLMTLFMPFNYGDAPANALTNPALDPIAKIPEFKVCAVSLGRND